MNLQFSILWFDDSKEYFESLDLDTLKNKIHSWGFIPDIQTVTSPHEFQQYHPFSQFDLIVVDFNLGSTTSGEKFIKDIRKHSVYTDIMFYTVGNIKDLWQAVATQQLGGIFVVHRQNIITRIEELGQHIVHKVLDLGNMRGIVMAEVGELDTLLDNLILLGMEHLDEISRKKMFNSFIKRCQKQHESELKRIQNFIKAPTIDEMLKLSDSNKRWQNFMHLRKKIPSLKNLCPDSYDKDVLKPRNILAHGVPQKQKNGDIIFYHHNVQYPFNLYEGRKLRQTILNYKKCLEETIKVLEKGT